ncbi:DUF3857 domain-containing transglutaminase family protein [Brevundimonas sp. FT23042]|uniref:DUF3857 domain-containing transglutaminase family protein n=1 Tax=Brevundimonas sp. FT23042 TaxID=3393749 RepID=UPI003B587BC2
MSYDSPVSPRSRLEFTPVPAGFDLPQARTEGRDPRDLTAGGLCHWLSQAQADLTGPEPVHTSRNIVQVTGSEGLQPAASVSVHFNPEYERVAIHAVRVHRDGAIREAGRPEAFEVIQRELNMERAVYDGRMTAHMVIPDVREGDVVETILSVIGAPPALAGLFSWSFILQWNIPVVETRCTVRAAPERALAVRSAGPAVTTRDVVIDGVRVLEWTAVDAPPVNIPPGTPPTWEGFSTGHVADDVSWSAIADVFRPFYDARSILPEGLTAEVRALEEAHPRPAARVTAGLRMVQSLLRYHSVSIGEGGYRPRPLETIWETRYGDCKDASLLLTAVLRAMDIDAVCALVNTGRGEALPQGLPHVLAFNHCIVRVRLNGGVVWLDPTMSAQAGDLEHLTRAMFGWALPLEADAGLEVMPRPRLRTTNSFEEVWDIPHSAADPAELTLTTVYRSWRADGIRHWLNNQSRDGAGRQLRESLERELNSSVVALADHEVSDDPVENVLTLVERYRVTEPYAARDNGTRVFISRDEVVGPHLMDVASHRSTPLEMGLPRRIETRRVFRFARPVDVTPWRLSADGPTGLHLESSFEWTSPREGLHQLMLVVPGDTVPVEAMDAYKAFVEKARGMNGISFPVLGPEAPASGGRRGGGGGDVNWGWVAVIAFFLISGLIRLLAAAG